LFLETQVGTAAVSPVIETWHSDTDDVAVESDRDRADIVETGGSGVQAAAVAAVAVAGSWDSVADDVATTTTTMEEDSPPLDERGVVADSKDVAVATTWDNDDDDDNTNSRETSVFCPAHSCASVRFY